MGLVSSVVDRVLNRPLRARRRPPSALAREIHAEGPVVDLVVGSALFRDKFVSGAGRGHADLPRLRAGGVNVIGLTVATRFPDLRGTLSNLHFRSLGLPASAVRSDMGIAGWVLGRIEGWVTESAGGMLVVRSAADLERCLAPDGPIGVLIGVQGGHVLDGEPANIERLHRRGVRMLALAHVMDNELVGSGTGRRAHGLTPFGREVIAELERVGVIVDLAHMSVAGIDDALPLMRHPFALSHTGLVEVHGPDSRWRRYAPARRNLPVRIARDVGQAGGLIGAVLGRQLIGGGLEKAVELVERLVESAGAANVAIGSDMDGALRAPIDAAGLPLLTDALLEAGLGRSTVEGVVGRNAVALLRAALPA